MFICVCTYIYLYMCVHVCTHMHICVHMYTYMCICLYVYVYVYVYTYMCTLCYMFHLRMCIYTWCNSNLEKKSYFIHNDEWGCCPYICMDYMFECAWTHTSTNTSTYTYKQLQRHIYAGICTGTLTHTHLPHTHFVVLKFYCSSIPISHKTYYLFVTLYSQAIFKYFITVCIFNITNQVVNKSWINDLRHLVHEGILGNYYPDIFSENCFPGLSFWFIF